VEKGSCREEVERLIFFLDISLNKAKSENNSEKENLLLAT